MERNGAEEPVPVKGRALLVFCVAAMCAAIFVHLGSDLCAGFMRGQPVHIAVLGSNPAVVTYNAAAKKAQVLFVPQEDVPASGTNNEKAVALIRRAGGDAGAASAHYVIISTELDKNALWLSARQWLVSWRAHPAMMWRFARDYMRLRRSGECNLSPAEFVALTMEMIRVPVPDIVVSFGGESSAAAVSSAAETVDTEMLRVDVYNATGAKGMALQATRYLRELNLRKIQNIDVISFNNYSHVEKTSRIISHTERLSALSMLAKNLGMETMEIVSDPGKEFSDIDATVILGQDFSVPKDFPDKPE